MLHELAQRGVHLSLDGEELRVETPAPLTDEQRAYLRRHKAELIAELQQRPVVGGVDDPCVIYRPGEPCPDPRRLSLDASKAIERVTRKLVSAALRYYRDDGADFETMADDEIETAVVVFIGRELYVQQMLGITGAAAAAAEYAPQKTREAELDQGRSR